MTDLDHQLLALAASLPLVDELSERLRREPGLVEADWQALFATAATQEVNASGSPVQPQGASGPPPRSGADTGRAGRVYSLVNAYRVRGHLAAQLDPLADRAREGHPDLDPRSHGFDEQDLAQPVPSGGFHGRSELSLAALLDRLRTTYCGALGVEVGHISDPDRRAFVAERMELAAGELPDRATRLHILDRLVAAHVFDHFVHIQYVGTKRFSIEGGESLLPLLHLAVEHAGATGVEEVVLGMAHRGRLNVLANLLGKRGSHIFAEFEDVEPLSILGGGDVKYHLGYSADLVTRGGRPVHLTLTFNPSHLEAVDPVVMGRVRAKQRRRKDLGHERVLGLLVHGDAAFAGQGLVAETLNLSQLRGYRTGGTLHVIVNNQIGFTTASADSRSTPYATDVAKMIQVPIVHVNGDDPDAVARGLRLAMDFRTRFRSDVVLDLYCFRRFGHNEGDEPSFTQPLLYQRIEHHPPVYEIYARRLASEGVIAAGDELEMARRHEERWREELARGRAATERPTVPTMGGYWAGYLGGLDHDAPEAATAVPLPRLAEIAERTSWLPPGFVPHPKIVRLLTARAAMGRGERPIDWGMAETLGYGSLLWEGTLVRLGGQDSRRGTFSHRHAAVVDIATGAEYTPLNHLHPAQGEFRIYDSMLSEAAVLGFEFGYSLDYPDGLVMWEAQFGDFVNGAQVIVDQFVSSSEDKWKRLSGLVMVLPHGYEGQGPEHSSARYERFLQLAAEDNFQVCQPTTPAQLFHLLRRQVLRRWRKPLILLSPKRLLRLPEARSTLGELAAGSFTRVLDDPAPPERLAVARVLLCSGKIFYTLADARRQRREDATLSAAVREAALQTAIVRLEQLYPLADAAIEAVLGGYPRAREVVWVQDEPANMGAHGFLRPQLLRVAAGRALRAVTRSESASPATGSHRAHEFEERDLIEQAFSPIPAEPR